MQHSSLDHVDRHAPRRLILAMPRSQPPQLKSAEAARLKRLRDHLDLSQKELAAEFKVVPSAIGNWESCDRTIPGSVLKLIELYEDEFGLEADDTNPDPVSVPPVSHLARSLFVSTATAGIAGSGLRQLFLSIVSSERNLSKIKKEIYYAMAKKFADRLAEMKGLGIKTIQTLNHYDFALPPEIRDVFARYQTINRPMPQKKISQVFAKEFGKPPKRIFTAWASKPLATASIGQVHLAKLPSGERVAVKVQYPMIGSTIKADLKNLAVLSKGLSFVMQGQDWKATLLELGERFAEECDYLKEAENQELFARIYRSRADIVIPKVYRDFSSRHVLVSEYAFAKSFDEFNKTATQEERDLAGATIWKFGFESVLCHGLFNADPHPGNYLFADKKVVFLDFGCVKRFEPKFIKNWKRMIQAIHEEDRRTFKEVAIAVGFAPRPEKFDFDHFYETSKILYSPFLRNDVYAFGSDYREKTWRGLFVNTPNRSTQCLPKDWIFLTRLTWGLSSVLSKLGSRANWRKLGLQMIYDDDFRPPRLMRDA